MISLQVRELDVDPRSSRAMVRQPLRPMGIGCVFLCLCSMLACRCSACHYGSMPCAQTASIAASSIALCSSLAPMRFRMGATWRSCWGFFCRRLVWERRCGNCGVGRSLGGMSHGRKPYRYMVELGGLSGWRTAEASWIHPGRSLVLVARWRGSPPSGEMATHSKSGQFLR